MPNESRVTGCPTISSAVYPSSDVSEALTDRTMPRTSVVMTAIGSDWNAATSRSASSEKSDIFQTLRGEVISTERHIT